MRTAQTACARLLAACAATAIGSTFALAAGPEVIYSEVASHASSSVPGARGFDGLPAAAHFATITDLTSSPDRSTWMVKATTDQDPDLGQVLILGSGLTGNTLMQESLPVPGAPATSTVDFVGFDSFPSGGFNDAGDFAFAVRVDNDGTIAETIMRSIGGTLAPYIDQFSPLFGLQDQNGAGDEIVGNTVDSVHFLNDGRVAWRAGNIGNIHSSNRPAVMFNDNDVLAQAGVTMFTDMFTNTVALSDIRSGQFCITPDAAHWLINGELDYGISSPVDAVLIVDGQVVIQEGQFIPGTTILASDNETLGPVDRALMLADGTWFARGDTDPDLGDGQWALRSGVPIAQTGTPITPGAAENWGDLFLVATGTVGGNYVVAGRTDDANPDIDTVVVLNGDQVVLREGDPVDLDGNGSFDDDVFIGAIASDDMFLTEDFQLYFITTLRNGLGTTIGDAFLREQILTPTPGDVAVQINDSPDPLGVIGGQIAYSVTVRNFSPDPATNVVVTTNLDPLTSYVSSTAGVEAAGVHTATFVSLPALSSQTYQIVVQANSAGNPAATTTIAATETDPNTANNTAAAETTVTSLADLTVTVVDSPDPLNAVGGQITYDVTVANNGPSTADGVVLTADLAPESTFFSTTAGSHSGGVVTANLGAIASGASQMVTIVVDAGANGAYTTSINATGSTADPATTDNTAVATTDVLIDADLVVDASIDPPALGGVGQQATYTLEITNEGPTDATGVDWSLSLPAEVTYISSSSGTHVAGLVSGTVSSLAVDATETITVLVESNAIGDDLPANFTANPTVPGDADGVDNSATVLLTVLDLSGGSNIEILVADDDLNTHAGGDLATSQAPGISGRQFESFSKIYGSGDGSNWITEANLDGSTTTDNVVLTSVGGDLQIALQEGVTLIPDASGQDIDSDFDFKLGINNSGTYAVMARATSSIETILKGSGSNISGGVGTLTLIAKGGNPFPFNPAFTYSTSSSPGLESPNILDNGDVVFLADTSDTATEFDEYVLRTSDDGATVTVLAQEGVTTPLNSADAWDDFDQNDIHVTPDGAHTLMHGDVGTASGFDKSLVYDSNIVIQEGVTVLPGFGTTVQDSTPMDDTFLAANGDWYAWGTNENGSSDTEHWMVRNGQVIAQSGAPLFPGSTELWRFGSTSSSFNALAADANGNYVVCGFTDNPDTADNAVAVLNGERVVAREMDPVDLDGNGVFDDNTFIGDIGNGSTITTDFGVITPDGKLIIPVKLRTFDATTRIGDAIVAIDLGLAPACVCETDGDANQVNVFDLLAYLDHWFPQDAEADIDGTPGVNVFDLLFYLDCWFPASAGSPC